MLSETAPKNSKMSSRRRGFKPMLLITCIAVFGSLSLTSCSSMSDETKSQGKDVICAAGGGLSAQIRTSGAVSKFVASIVKDNSTGDIQVLAEKIANGQGDQKAADDLANYVDSLCG